MKKFLLIISIFLPTSNLRAFTVHSSFHMGFSNYFPLAFEFENTTRGMHVFVGRNA